MNLPRIVTTRMLMRRWLPEDREPFAEMCANPAVMRFFMAPLSHRESCALIERIERHFDENGFGLWALERKTDGRLLGFTGLQTISLDCPVKGDVEIGWRLDQEFWGQGYATEAARAALDFGFERLAVPRLVSLTARVNNRSRLLMERIGMQGVQALDFDHPGIPEGHELRPHLVYAITRPR